MCKFKMKLLYNEEESRCTEIGLLSFMLTLLLPKLDIIGARLEPNGPIFSGGIWLDMELITFWLLLSYVTESSIGEKTKKCW